MFIVSEIRVFTKCFGKLGHLQAIKLCNEYVERNYEHRVSYKEI
jgi:hypothetical protein